MKGFRQRVVCVSPAPRLAELPRAFALATPFCNAMLRLTDTLA